ncbi:MAG: T9SS type A sorting domain-containing protein [Ignavibacteria bacterium]|nr:T9SS type A sorting domain-containing protein [Ignavibacteria bacterium]
MKRKINILLAAVFLSFIVVAYNNIKSHDEILILGATKLNGNGCVCHGLDADSSVVVWVEGPDSLHGGETALYRMFLTGGPAEGGGYNVAGRFGIMTAADSTSVGHPLAPNELTQAFTLPFPSTDDTLSWAFYYTASGTVLTDTIYSVGISCDWDSVPDYRDRWNFGPNFPLTILPPLTAVSDFSPIEYTLYQNYPNPFNPITTIKYSIQKSSLVNLKVYDMQGKEVAILVNEEKPAGVYNVQFNSSNLSSGIYFYRIQAGSFNKVMKMILIK